jgi:hypothetical protein
MQNLPRPKNLAGIITYTTFLLAFFVILLFTHSNTNVWPFFLLFIALLFVLLTLVLLISFFLRKRKS